MKKIALVVVVLAAGLAVYEFTGNRHEPHSGPQEAQSPSEEHDPELANPTPRAEAGTLPSPGGVDLRGIVRQGGRPIAARVEVRRMGGAGALEPGHWYLDAGAAVQLPPRDGPVLQQVESASDGGFEVAGLTPARYEIRVPRAKRISGRVVVPDGVSLQAVDLAARPVDETGARGGLLGRLRHAPVAADGSFSIEGLTADGYRLCASGWSEDTFYSAEADAAPGDTGVALALRATEPDVHRDGLRIRIRTSAGAPVCQGYLELWSLREDGRSGGTSGVGFGSYPVIVQAVPRGKSLWIFVTGAKDETGGALPAGAVLLGPLEPEHATIDVTLPPERTLRGRVTAEDGTGIAGVAVRALPAQDVLLWDAIHNPHFHPGARTGPDGSFELHGLGDLDYEVHVEAPPGHAPVAPVRLRPGAEPLQITLRPAAVVRLQVQDWSGKPVVGTRVRYREDPGEVARRDRERASRSPRAWEHYVMRWWDPRVRKPLGTNDRGEVSLPDLDPGKHYELFLQGPASRHDLAPVLEFGWTPKREATLAFGRVWRIQGVVQDLGGTPVANVRVELHVQNSRGLVSATARTDADGGFTLAGLPPGTYPVRAIAYRRTKVAGRPSLEHLGEVTVDIRSGERADIEIPAKPPR